MLASFLLLPLAFGATEIDLPKGTILCRDLATAESLVDAVETGADRVQWLMAGACDRMDVAFEDQRVLDEGPVPRVEWSNGIFRRDRFVIPATIAERIDRGRLAAPQGDARILTPGASGTGRAVPTFATEES